MRSQAFFEMQPLASVVCAEVEHARDIRDLSGYALAGTLKKMQRFMDLGRLVYGIMILNRAAICKFLP